jgi:hypothetical protein
MRIFDTEAENPQKTKHRPPNIEDQYFTLKYKAFVRKLKTDL